MEVSALRAKMAMLLIWNTAVSRVPYYINLYKREEFCLCFLH